MNDTVVPVEGTRKLMETFVEQVDKSPLVGYTEVPDVDHMGFLVGKDLSYFDKVLDYVDLYNKNDDARKKEVDKVKKERLSREEKSEQEIRSLEL